MISINTYTYRLIDRLISRKNRKKIERRRDIETRKERERKGERLRDRTYGPVCVCVCV